MIILPTDTDADYTQSIVLESVSYDFRFKWNTQEGAWYMDLGPTGLDPVLIGVKLTTASNLLGIFSYLEGIPPGNLLMVDLEASIGRVDRRGFSPNGRYALIYFTEAEYDNLQQGIFPRVR